jgi:hypothetical protein
MNWHTRNPTLATGRKGSDTGPTRLRAARGNFTGADPNGIWRQTFPLLLMLERSNAFPKSFRDPNFEHL